MNFRVRFLLVFLGLVLLLWTCSENPVDLGNRDYPDPTLNGQFRVDTLYAQADTSFPFQSVVDTKASNRLLLGRFQNMVFRPIVKFNRSVGFPINVRVLAARVRFGVKTIFGDTVTARRIVAYPILNEWQSNTDPQWQDYLGQIDRDHPIGEVNLPPFPEDTLSFAIPDTQRVRSWTDTSQSAANYGFLLDFEDTGTDFLIELEAGPRLRFAYHLPTGEFTRYDSSFTADDAFLIEGSFPLDTARFRYVTTLRPRALVLQFDFQPFLNAHPDGLIMTSANLVVPFLPQYSWIHPDFEANFYLRAATLDNTTHSVKVDSSLLPLNFNPSPVDSQRVQIAFGTDRRNLALNYLQRLRDEPQRFNAFWIEFKDQVDYVSYFAFTPVAQLPASQRPYLVLYYWVPPGARF